MIDGIDYYPKKRKKTPKLKWMLVLLMLVLASGAAYWYLNKSQDSPTKSTPTMIVISKGEKEKELIETSVIINQNQTSDTVIDKRVNSSKGLDEVIQNYTNEQQ